MTSTLQIDPAADFLLDLLPDNLFEPVGDTAFRCKGCQSIVKRTERLTHFNAHKEARKMTSTTNTEKPAKPKKATAADLGVPKVYLSDKGSFKVGMDARLKSDLILAILEQPAPGAAHKWTKADAEAMFAKFPHWQGFLERKTAILAASAAKVAEKQAQKAEREKAKAEAKKTAATAKANTKEGEKSATSAQGDLAGAAKPQPKPASAKRGRTAGRSSKK